MALTYWCLQNCRWKGNVHISRAQKCAIALGSHSKISVCQRTFGIIYATLRLYSVAQHSYIVALSWDEARSCETPYMKLVRGAPRSWVVLDRQRSTLRNLTKPITRQMNKQRRMHQPNIRLSRDLVETAQKWWITSSSCLIRSKSFMCTLSAVAWL